MLSFSQNMQIMFKNDEEKHSGYMSIFEDDLLSVLESTYLTSLDEQLESSIREKYKDREDKELLCDKEILSYSYEFYWILKQYFENLILVKHNQNKIIDLDQDKKTKYKRTDRVINNDIDTIQSFIDLLKKNCIYDDNLERNYSNKQDDKFVYDYCLTLINDLKTKQFNKSTLYKRTLIKANKNDIKIFFNKLKEEHSILKSNDVKQLINSINNFNY